MIDEEKPACADKLAFDSQKQANDEAIAVKWRRGTELKAYHCRECDLWHLSSKTAD